MKRVPVLVALPLVILSGACSGEKENSRATAVDQVIRGVEIVVVRPEAVEDSFESVGTIKARQSAPLSSKTVGTIIAVMAREGDRVRKGQTLIEIDSRDLRADLQGAQAALEEANWAIRAGESAVTAARGQKDLAEATFKRYQPLAAKGSVTPQEFDEVGAKNRVANAELERAEENLRAAGARKKQAEARVSYAQTLLGYSQIVSPFDGVVTAKSAEVGMLASPGHSLMTVEQSGFYRLEAQVGESWLAGVKTGMTVPVAVDAIDKELGGRVGEIVPAADPQSRTFTIKVDIPSHPLVRSGLYGKVRISTGRREALLVPLAAVIEKGQLVGLYAVDDSGTVRLRIVSIGKHYGEKVEVLSGVTPGDRIVARGTEKISEGSRVSPPAKK